MARTKAPALSPLSAALALVLWRQEHDRWPRVTECTKQYGLPHWTMLYRLFPDYPAVVATASALWGTICGGLSGGGRLSGISLTVETRPCLRCGTPVPWQAQRDVRHCAACRAWLAKGNDDVWGGVYIHYESERLDEEW